MRTHQVFHRILRCTTFHPLERNLNETPVYLAKAYATISKQRIKTQRPVDVPEQNTTFCDNLRFEQSLGIFRVQARVDLIVEWFYAKRFGYRRTLRVLCDPAFVSYSQILRDPGFDEISQSRCRSILNQAVVILGIACDLLQISQSGFWYRSI